MLESIQSQKLLIALAVIVYSFLSQILRDNISVRQVVIWICGVMPFVVWLGWPHVLEAGAFSIGSLYRSGGLVLAAVAIGLQYGAARSQDRKIQHRKIMAILAAALITTGITLATVNWLVGVGIAILSATTLGGYLRTPRDRSNTE